MASLLELLPRETRSLARRRKQPEWVEPMKAVLTEDHFASDKWVYERKLDGVRLLVFRTKKGVRLVTRNKLEANATYPEIEAALLAQPARDFIADGEVVAFDRSVTSFAKLQGRLGIRDREIAWSLASQIKVYLYLFDLIQVDGYDVTALGLRERKKLLENLLEYKDPLRFSKHRDTHGERFLAEACRKGWEGLIAKRADSRYRHARSDDWLKFKCMARQEFVIGGYTEPRGSRVGLGALLIGYNEDGRFRFAGKVGTGMDTGQLLSLTKTLKSRELKRSPFDEPVAESGAHWVRPELVCEVGFTEWTPAGKLRHPRFFGLRTDKTAREVVREAAR